MRLSLIHIPYIYIHMYSLEWEQSLSESLIYIDKRLTLIYIYTHETLPCTYPLHIYTWDSPLIHIIYGRDSPGDSACTRYSVLYIGCRVSYLSWDSTLSIYISKRLDSPLIHIINGRETLGDFALTICLSKRLDSPLIRIRKRLSGRLYSLYISL